LEIGTVVGTADEVHLMVHHTGVNPLGATVAGLPANPLEHLVLIDPHGTLSTRRFAYVEK